MVNHFYIFKVLRIKLKNLSVHTYIWSILSNNIIRVLLAKNSSFTTLFEVHEKESKTNLTRAYTHRFSSVYVFLNEKHEIYI